MIALRFATAFAAIALLSACGGDPEPAAPTPQAESKPAAAAAPATPAAPVTPAATPATAEGLAPLFGSWAGQLADCGTLAIQVSETRFEGAENSCDIAGFSDNSDGSFTASMSCTGEGAKSEERVKMRPLFAPTGEAIGLTYLDRDNAEATVLRCNPPAAQ